MARIIEAKIWPLSAQLEDPIEVSFGAMRTRPGFLLSLTDEHSRVGWGESWINFPQWAPWERTFVMRALLNDIVGSDYSPKDVPLLYQKYLPQVVQWGGIGPFSHALSAIECALWDLYAKERAVPLFTALAWELGGDKTASAADGSTARQRAETKNVAVPVYGSGIGPTNAEKRVENALADGFRAVKLKIGFDSTEDRRRVKRVLATAGMGSVMVDANQGWNRDTAVSEIPFYTDEGVKWVEEPISALDTEGYHMLTRQFDRIAAGENWYVPTIERVAGLPLRVFQPDLCKVGGVWAAQSVSERGPRSIDGIAFHVLGLPLSHAFAMHVAAAWPETVSYVEVDTNENPLASTCTFPWTIQDGIASWQGTAGIGVETAGIGVEMDEELLSAHVISELIPFCTVRESSRVSG